MKYTTNKYGMLLLKLIYLIYAFVPFVIIFTLTSDSEIRQIHRKICKIYVKNDLQDVSQANMSNQRTRFLGKIPIRSDCCQ